jgi:hypothetical protein
MLNINQLYLRNATTMKSTVNQPLIPMMGKPRPQGDNPVARKGAWILFSVKKVVNAKDNRMLPFFPPVSKEPGHYNFLHTKNGWSLHQWKERSDAVQN